MKRKIEFSSFENYHIYNRGNDKRVIFHDIDDYDRFIKLLYLCNGDKKFNINDIKKNGDWDNCFQIDRGNTIVDIGAWCLMPNHFHLLIRESNLLLEARPQEVSEKRVGITVFMQRLLTGYSMYYNKKYNRIGTLFSGRFMAKHLSFDQYLKYQYAYIHLNPISIVEYGWKLKKILDKKNCKDFLNEYKYSSYLDYCGFKREQNAIINKNAFPEYFTKAVDFKDMIEEWLNFTPEISLLEARPQEVKVKKKKRRDN
jgi:putative transposase